MSGLPLWALVACSNDFTVSNKPDVVVIMDDTGTAPPPPVDTAGTPTPVDSGSTGDTTTTVPGDPDTTDPVETDPPDEDDCTETSDLVYVIARDDGALYTFDPASLSFTRLARINCGTSQTPASMAVSRDGYAYVRYGDNSVHQVDLGTYTCGATPYSDRSTRFGSFGMGYATDTSGTWRDQLYVASEDTLAVLDTSSFTLTPIGGLTSQSELTGNADGELWAFLPLEAPARLVQLDKTSGATLSTLRLPGFPDASDLDTFAFATWGGSFWLFVRESGMGNSTDVYEVDSGGTLTRVLSDVGFDVVGAGVSTCAPS